MWLLAGVRLLRALRMSHRFTFFTLPTACAVSCWVGWVCLCFLCFVWLCLVLCFAFLVLVPGFCMCSRHLFDLNFDLNCRCFQMTDNASSLARLC